MEKVISADGTPIAYDQLGDGPPVILIAAALCHRGDTRPLAEELARHFTVFNYDRRGRGDSGDGAPHTVQGEIEDLTALISQAGGTASVYAHSSGAALALHAAALGGPIARLVLHEPPYTPSQPGTDQRQRQAEEDRVAREQAEAIKALLAEDRRAEAIELHLARTGMPRQLVEQMSHDPAVQAMAHTLPHDPFGILSSGSRSGATPAEQAADVSIPTLLLCGGASFDWMIETGRQLAAAMPNGRHHVMPGQGHIVPAKILAPVLADFLADR